MPLIGLTGGLATGKSLVASIFTGMGAHLLDCDALAREIVAPGADGLQAVAREFGAEILLADGALNRRALADIVFNDSSRLKALEKITHPLIEKLIEIRSGEILTKTPDAVVIVDAALLFETGLYRRMEKNIVVICDPAIQIQRALKRGGMTKQSAESRIKAQWPLSRKAEMADYVVDNNGTPQTTAERARAIWQNGF